MGQSMKVHGRKSKMARKLKRTGGSDMPAKKRGKKKMSRQEFIDKAEDALGDQPL